MDARKAFLCCLPHILPPPEEDEEDDDDAIDAWDRGLLTGGGGGGGSRGLGLEPAGWRLARPTRVSYIDSRVGTRSSAVVVPKKSSQVRELSES